MFKKEKQTNKYDTIYSEKWNNIHEMGDILEGKTYQIITKKGVIDVYPDGKDKNLAIEELEKAKNNLLCTIERYDSILNDIKQYWKINHKNFEKCKTWNPDRLLSSHLRIEVAYRKYYK